MTLAWDAVPQPEVVGYLVSYGTHSGVYDHSVDAGAKTSQELVGLADATTYYFIVRSYTATGQLSVPSVELAACTVGCVSTAIVPGVPSMPTPADLAAVPATTTLGWAATSDTTSYALALGTTNPPPVVVADQVANVYQPVPALAAGTTYYWQITAKGPGGVTIGPVWSFTTLAVANPPTVPSTPTPANGATNLPTTTTLAWAASTGATQYDIALGANNPPPIVATNQSAASYAPASPLAAGMTYYWSVIAKGPGGSTAGPVWSFTTAASGGAAAAFLRTDSTTAGSWKGVYGRDGYVLAASTANVPTCATLTPINLPLWTWTPSTSDPRALQYAATSDRFAATWYSDGTIDLNFTDGAPHDFAMYLIDWDSTSRTETVQILDAASGTPLDTRTVSNFNAGQYIVWRVIGHIKVTFTRTAGTNAVVSALFFDPIPGPPAPGSPAGPMPADGATNVLPTIALNWAPSINASTYDVAFGTTNPPASVATGLSTTSYQPASLAAGTTYYWRVTAKGTGGATTGSVWSFTTAPLPGTPSSPTPVNGAQKVPTTTSIGWVASANAMSYDVAFGTANPPQIVSSNQTATTYQPSALASGTTYYWQVMAKGAGGVTAGPVWSFTTAAPLGTAATLLGVDSRTAGSWKGVYGRDGYAIANDATSLPAYAVMAQTGQLSWTWAASTTDPRALQKSAVAADRLAAAWYGGSFTMDLNLVDGAAHQIALYALDWETTSRAETIQLFDAVTGALLDSRTVTGFHGGQYWVWTVSGHVTLRVTVAAGTNAVLSALFFDTAGAPPTTNVPPTVALTKPTGGASYTAPATIALAANAADADGAIAKVDFYNGATLVATAAAAPYEATLTNLAAGSYNFTAVATDNSGASTTSAPVPVTVAAPPVRNSAAFIGTDRTTDGNWKGVYGGDGYAIANEGGVAPSYAAIGQSGMVSWTWVASTKDGRALQKIATSDRIASAWYSTSAFSLDVRMTDGLAHEIALYLVDWESNARVETIQLVDADTGTVLDTRTPSKFHGGEYWIWTVSGHVTIRVTRTAGINAVVSGVFFDR